MSTLARSLFALAALLAAADAKIRPLYDPPKAGSPCTGFIMDIPTRQPYAKVIEEINFKYTSYNTDQLANITDLCAAIGADIASERVEICNIHPYPTMELLPPNVIPLGEEILSPVYVSCEGAYKGECGPITFHITQKCRPAAKYF